MTDAMMTTTEKALAINNIWTEPIPFKGKTTEYYGVTDGKELFGIVSKQYKPVTHAKTLANVREWLPEAKISNTYTENNLRRVVFNLLLPKVYSLNGEGIQTFLNLRNSLDGSWTIGMLVSPVNVVCRNTYVLSFKQAYVSISKKHTRNGVAEFFAAAPQVADVYAALEGQLEIAERLLTRKTTTARGRVFIEDLIKKGLVGKRVGARVIEHLEKPEFKNEEPSSMLGVYNALTNVMTRELEEKQTVGSFDNIVRAGEAFAELVTV